MLNRVKCLFLTVFIFVVLNIGLLIAISTKLMFKQTCSTQRTFISERIIAGKSQDVQKYPFIAALVHVLSDDSNRFFFCGAVIVSKHWVISADHCYRNYIYEQYLSEDDISVFSNNNAWRDGIRHEVVKWVRHPSNLQEGGRGDYDIALFRVSEPFTAEFEKPIKVAKSGYVLRESTTVKVLGWGATSGNFIIVQDELRGVNLKLYKDEDCRNIFHTLHVKYPDYDFPQITDLMFCAGPRKISEKSDSCTYDSGGPLVDNDVLVGIVSWGVQEGKFVCGEGYPGVYVRLWKCEQWIHEVEAAEGETIAEFKIHPSWLSSADTSKS